MPISQKSRTHPSFELLADLLAELTPIKENNSVRKVPALQAIYIGTQNRGARGDIQATRILAWLEERLVPFEEGERPEIVVCEKVPEGMTREEVIRARRPEWFKPKDSQNGFFPTKPKSKF